jgi:hypothetical protein
MITKGMFVKSQFSLALTRKDLMSLKSRALRRRSWFRVLERVERALIDLTIKVVNRVRSPVLYKALVLIVKKLEDASERRVSRATREVGFPCIHRLSLLAQKWGNKSAQNWMFDLSFARFIAIMHINCPASYTS